MPLEPGELASDAASVETTVHIRELQAFVRRSLAEMPDRHRAVLVLRDLEDGDPALVARRLRVTRGALKVRAHRARTALRLSLTRLGVEGPVASVGRRAPTMRSHTAHLRDAS